MMIGNFNDELSRSPYGNKFLAMQRPETFEAFDQFIKKEKPKLVVEIGTAYGGLSFALFNACKRYKTKFITYDIIKNASSEELFAEGVDFRVENIFFDGTPSWQEYTLRPAVLAEFDSYKSPRIFLCDGGNKVGEFNAFAKIVRSGDILMAHDFAYNKQHHQKNLNEGIWAWAEILEDDIRYSLQQYQLSYYNMSTWEKLAWACTKKG